MSEASRGKTVDPIHCPNLYRLQMLVDEQEDQLQAMREALPFRISRWLQAVFAWKRAANEWRRIKPLAEREVRRAG